MRLFKAFVFFVSSIYFILSTAQAMLEEKNRSCFQKAAGVVTQKIIQPVINVVKKYPQLPLTLGMEALFYLWLRNDMEAFARSGDRSNYLAIVIQRFGGFVLTQLAVGATWLMPLTAEQARCSKQEELRREEEEIRYHERQAQALRASLSAR